MLFNDNDYYLHSEGKLLTLLVVPYCAFCGYTMMLIDSPLLTTIAYHYEGLVDYVRRNFSQSRHDQHFAHEVVHEVCVNLMVNPPSQQVHTPLAFLRTMLKHQAIDYYRKMETRGRYIDYVENASEIHMHHQDGASVLDFVQKLEALKGIIEALPPRQRQIFLLHRVYDMPQQEISDTLGISRNMVTQHFTRALTTIARQWTQYMA